MSPARRFRDRKLGLPVEPKPKVESAAVDSAAPEDAFIRTTVANRPPAHSAAKRLRERGEAAAAMQHQLAMQAANDNQREEQHEPAGPYELMRIQLAEHKKQLSASQSIERRIDHKRALLSDYDSWIDGALAAAAAEGKAAPDEIVSTIFVWAMDCQDWERALRIAEHLVKHALPMPPKFKRDLATFIAEEVADAALKAYAVSSPFDGVVIECFADLVAGADMPDEVKARLEKARGMARLRFLADAEADERQIAGGRVAALKDALVHLRRAFELDERSGVKTEIARLERELAKETA